MPKEETESPAVAQNTPPTTTTGPSASPRKTIKVIAYKGRVVTTRVISKADMEKLGVSIEEDLVWNRENGHVIDASKLSDKAIEIILKDKQFEIREG